MYHFPLKDFILREVLGTEIAIDVTPSNVSRFEAPDKIVSFVLTSIFLITISKPSLAEIEYNEIERGLPEIEVALVKIVWSLTVTV